MKVMAKTKEMSRQEWLQQRSKGIGGSDCSVIMGDNPWKSKFELWKEKTGQKELVEEENDFLHFGTVLEPIVRDEFVRRTGIKVRQKHQILQSEKYPWMLANLDGVINENGERVIFEAKTASAYKLEEWEQEVPREYYWQLQHYLCVTGYNKAYICALIGGNKFVIHEVYRNETDIERLVEAEKRFWIHNVLGGIEPEADGSEATATYLGQIYAEATGEEIELPEDALVLCEEYQLISAQLAELENKKREACNKLKQMLKFADAGVVGNRKISWKMVHKKSLDTTRLKAEQPDIYESYQKEGSYRRFMVA